MVVLNGGSPGVLLRRTTLLEGEAMVPAAKRHLPPRTQRSPRKRRLMFSLRSRRSRRLISFFFRVYARSFSEKKHLPDKFRIGFVHMSATCDPDKNLQRAIDRLD